MFGYDLGIDLGTTNIVIGVPGKGIRLDEPAYVAYDEEKEKVLYAGKRAYFLEGREPEGLRVERPILSGVVGHYELAQQMMRHFINKVIGNSCLSLVWWCLCRPCTRMWRSAPLCP